MTHSSPITQIKGIGTELAKKYSILGINTISDLIEHFPRKYEDYSQIQSIKNIKPGMVTIKGQIKQVTGRYVRRGMHITEAVMSDETGSVRVVWFNQPYRQQYLKKGEEYYLSGEFQLRRQRLSILNPSIEPVDSFPINTARIIPVYKETKGLKSQQIRRALKEVFRMIESMPESLPPWIINEQKLISRSDAILAIHFPQSLEDLEKAKARLGFEEVFELSLAALLNKYELMQEHAVGIPFEESLAKAFVSHLPFTLTTAQRVTTWQIFLDMQKTQPMNRLVEGDVGSGKTVVACMAAAMAIKEGFQVALMAPTEILARQHTETITKFLRPLNMDKEVVLLIGGLNPKQKKAAHSNIEKGLASFIIGTHALIQEKVRIKKLGLVIVDEQHRFGVEHRKKLQAKAGHMPHVLSLTATPIPRTLALTLYGELDISVLDSKPPGRKPIITEVCSPNSRKQLYEKINKQIDTGRQVFVVAPLIRESDMLPARSAEEVYVDLSQKHFKNRRVGLIHGQMKTKEKDAVMQAFLNHKLDILVSTTVIEVGVNVPNASVMLIENAERFGLAQIHQLRGRVGRSEHQGYCYLMLGDSSQPSRRIRALEQTEDGFELAELDLEIRGPGAIYGTLQHGALDLRIARLTDTRLIASARKSAQQFIDKGVHLVQYTQLASKVNKLRAVTNLN
jgi:ATP-dependent DNA helicase RecG